jgi:hypothetical protein
MKTRFNWIGADWKRVKNHCRTTVNKKFTDNEPGSEFKKKLLISEHTPIRLIEIDWSWERIKSWVSVHWVRHKHEKFVSTQRDDRKEHEISRDDMPQGTLVDMDNYANAQQLIDIMRKRLCYQASPETRELAEDFKVALRAEQPELADVLVPNCVYRCGCPEFQTCGYWNQFLKHITESAYPDLETVFYSDIFDIQKRYEWYNDFFYGFDEDKEVKDNG